MDFEALSFGERLRLARQAAGVTQKALADLLGIAQNQISVWEAGTSGPKRDRLPAIAVALKTTTDWLLDGKGKPPVGLATKPRRSIEVVDEAEDQRKPTRRMRKQTGA